MPPNTRGIRKCGAKIKAPPKKSNALANYPGLKEVVRPCGKKAVVSYKLRTQWGDDWICMCKDHDPKSEDIGDVKRALGGHLVQYGMVHHTKSATRLDEIIPMDNVQKERVIQQLVSIMGRKNTGKMTEADWRSALEEALLEFSTRKVVEE